VPTKAHSVAVAAPHQAAVDAAAEAVAAGGSPADAAVAAAAVLAVVYPHQCSLGGDLIALARPAGTGEVHAVLSAGAAPRNIDVAALRAASDRMPPGGPLSVTVPGAVAGLREISRRWGQLAWADLLRSAIRLARDGAPVSAGMARAIRSRAEVLDRDPGLAALVRPGGRSLSEGERFVQPALARTLERVAEDPDGFYRGALAADAAAGLAALGSPVDADDLAAHEAEVTRPLTAERAGSRWFVAPPPSQGALFLAALTGAPDGTPAALVRSARAAELARDAHLGDPRGGPIDVDALLAGRSEPGAAHPVPVAAGDTVAVTAVGTDGTAVSLIMSVYQSFGAGIMDPATGLIFHNRGSAFRLEAGHPGVVGPGVRPPHTLCPVIGEADGIVVALGCQGGRAQPWILAQVADGTVTSDDLTGLVGRPRWVIGSRELGRQRPTLMAEPGAPEAAAEAARELGLDVAAWPGPDDDAGHVQVARVRGGILDAASDPRADGRAVVA
jgi:Gamma-glutamyltransferase